MAYPNRTRGTVRHAGAAADTKFLDSPTDGGYNGSDTEAQTKAIEAFATTEATGVGTVETVT